MLLSQRDVGWRLTLLPSNLKAQKELFMPPPHFRLNGPILHAIMKIKCDHSRKNAKCNAEVTEST